MSTVGLDIVTAGWELSGWDRSFYPDDLPPDWRLTYFSNEFPAVLIPGNLWARADGRLLRTWVEEVHPGFRFYLAEPGSSVKPDNLDLAQQVLGDLLAGLVLGQPAEADTGGRVSRFQLLDNPSEAPANDCLPGWRAPTGVIKDPRAARAWIESLDLRTSKGCGLLVLDPDIGVDELRRWWDLARLMGVTA